MAITNVTFQLLDPPSLFGERVRLIVESDPPLSRAVPARVRVGNQEGRVGAFRLSDGALNVYLANVPDVGDVVYVGWVGEGTEATSFTYQTPVVG